MSRCTLHDVDVWVTSHRCRSSGIHLAWVCIDWLWCWGDMAGERSTWLGEIAVGQSDRSPSPPTPCTLLCVYLRTRWQVNHEDLLQHSVVIQTILVATDFVHRHVVNKFTVKIPFKGASCLPHYTCISGLLSPGKCSNGGVNNYDHVKGKMTKKLLYELKELYSNPQLNELEFWGAWSHGSWNKNRVVTSPSFTLSAMIWFCEFYKFERGKLSANSLIIWTILLNTVPLIFFCTWVSWRNWDQPCSGSSIHLPGNDNM